jgi:group II intron reverse transcriptase/maturase
LHGCFEGLNKYSSGGVDGKTWNMYKSNAKEDIDHLHSGFKSGQYRAPHIRRAYIPKGGGENRPLGIPTIEDKILQSAVSKVLTAVYEQEFYDFSYGYRPGKSAHQALQHLFEEVSFRGKRYIIDADMMNYFGSIDHQCMRKLLDQRIKDGVIRKQIDKWLKAGVLESGMVKYPKLGTPQGGSISPMLSNIYLHYVLDKWFTDQIQPLLKGRSSLNRFADDCVPRMRRGRNP